MGRLKKLSLQNIQLSRKISFEISINKKYFFRVLFLLMAQPHFGLLCSQINEVLPSYRRKGVTRHWKWHIWIKTFEKSLWNICYKSAPELDIKITQKTSQISLLSIYRGKWVTRLWKWHIWLKTFQKSMWEIYHKSAPELDITITKKNSQMKYFCLSIEKRS